MSTILALDGNSLFHRAYHAFAPRDGGATTLDRKGRPAWGVSGFLSLLAGVIERVKPDAIVIGFDDPDASLRRDVYPDYKATRGEHDQDLRDQLARTTELVRALGLTVVVPAGLEADDVVASASDLAAKNGWHCVVATSDRDSFALVSSTTTVMRLVNGGVAQAVMLTPETLEATVGVRGEHYLDYAALRGDKSDNLPGVNGIGEKTAAKLLLALGSVDAAYADIDAGGNLVTDAVGKMGLRLGAAGSEARTTFERNRNIMTLLRNVDLGDVLTRGPKLTGDEVRAVCSRHALEPSARLVRVISVPDTARPVRRPASEDVTTDEVMSAMMSTLEEPPMAEAPTEYRSGRREDRGSREPVTLVAYQVANPRPARSLLLR